MTRRPGKRGQKKIPCVQSREDIVETDFSSTLLWPWLLKLRGMPAPGEAVEESVVVSDDVLGIVAQLDLSKVTGFKI